LTVLEVAVEKKTTKKKKEESPSFEDKLKRLEEIVTELESGAAPLKETINLFEEGRDLTKQLTSELDDAEKKIELLVKDAEGELSSRPFEEEVPHEDREA
jgi:exodeoxyribonuclease VII small subunit